MPRAESPPHGQGGKLMPLNSRRVTGPILWSVAAMLGLPTHASAEELRQMINGRLEQVGRKPRDVLVAVGWGTVEAEEPGHVWLHDGEGPFLDGELLPADAPEGPPVSVDEAHAGAIVHGDRAPDREAPLPAERDRLAPCCGRQALPRRVGIVVRGAGEDPDRGDEHQEEAERGLADELS